MKTFSKFFLLFVLFSLYSFAQDLSVPCEMSANMPEGQTYAATGGRYKPSSNAPGQYFRILIVFAEFESDNSTIANWTKGSLPTWANDLIDQVPSSSYRSSTISDYFKKMSNGDFDVIGDIYPSIITVPTNQNYGLANQYVLGVVNNNIADFKRYDNWEFQNGSFVFSADNGDGYLDLVHIIYRWADGWSLLAGGIATLNFSNHIITHDGVRIRGGYPDIYSSGITTNNKGAYTDNFAFIQHFAHEFGHYLFGWGHTTEGGLMQGAPYGYEGITHAMNAWERERLGYIPFMDYYNGQSKTLRDYVETGDALKIQIASGEELIIENHQRHISYDQIIRGGALEGGWNPTSQLGKGIYVYYIKYADNYPCEEFMLTADGSWDWQYAGNINMPDGWPTTLPLIDRGNTYRYLPNYTANQVGKGDRNPWLKVNGLSSYENSRWHSRNQLTGQWVLTRNIMGDEQDAFNIGYNELITPWSNPSTTKYVNGSEALTNLAIKLISQDPSTGNITVQIFNQYSSILALPPSKPQNLKSTLNSTNQSILNWAGNLEPSLNGYKIYKAITTGNEPSNYTYVTTLPSSQTTWTDPVVNNQSGFSKIFYKIAAVDNSSQESVKSEYSFIDCLNGQVTNNITLTYTTAVNSNTTIVSGVILTIQNGANLSFTNGASLTVNGTLTAVGTSANHITFDRSGTSGTWGGIVFNSGSSGSIEYCNISHATTGINSSYTLPMIRHNTITNNIYGIYVSNIGTVSNEISYNTIQANTSRGICLYTASPKIYSNVISGNAYYGISTYQSSPYLYGNTITGHSLGGLNFSYYSSAKLVPWNAYGYYWGRGNNKIKNNTGNGISASYMSNLYLGSSPYGGYNSICNNTGTELSAYYNCAVTAQLNWWGAYPPNSSEFYPYQSTIDYTNALQTDPNPDPEQGMVRGSNGISNSSTINSAKSDLDKAYGLQLEGKFDEAIAVYDSYINANSTDSKSALALVRIDECYKLSGKQGAAAYLDNTIKTKANKNNELDAVSLELKNQYLIQEKKYEEAVTNFNELAKKFKANKDVEKHSLFNAGYVYLTYLNDYKNATDKFAELAAKYPDDELVSESAYLLGNLDANNQQKLASPNTSQSDLPVPTDYALDQNYPNPFNPATTISYQLPKSGSVTLKIFDMLGKEVMTLVNEQKEMGRYTVQFDASSLASGMYVYQLRVNDYTSTKKMLLLK